MLGVGGGAGVGVMSGRPMRRLFPGQLAAFLTRASAAGGFDPATGLFRQYATNEARIVTSPAGVLSILREPQSTNLCIRSSEFDNAAWVKATGVTVPVTNNLAPDGTLTADTLDSSAGNQITSTGVVPAASTTYTNSLHFKKTSGATYTPALYLALTGGSMLLYTVRLNTDTGIATAYLGGGFTAPSATVVEDAGDFWRLGVSGSSGNNTSLDMRVYPNFSAGGVVAAGSQIIWGAQIEANPGMTTYIPTAATTVTRSRDVLVIPTVVAAGAPYSEVIDFVQPWSGNPTPGTNPRLMADGSGGLYWDLFTNDNSATRNIILYNGSSLTTANAYTVNARSRVAACADASGRAVCLNGGTVAANAGTQGAITQRVFGQYQTTSDNYANPLYIHEYRQARRRLSSAELQWHTTA